MKRRRGEVSIDGQQIKDVIIQGGGGSGSDDELISIYCELIIFNSSMQSDRTAIFFTGWVGLKNCT